MTSFSANIPGDQERLYTVNIEKFDDFEKVKVDLVNIEGVEDATFNDQIAPAEIALFTNGEITDVAIQQVVAKHGFSAFPKTLLLS